MNSLYSFLPHFRVPPQYGTPVEDFHCATAAPQHTKSCDIPCPVNCEVTQWTHWGDCLPMKCKYAYTLKLMYMYIRGHSEYFQCFAYSAS